MLLQPLAAAEARERVGLFGLLDDRPVKRENQRPVMKESDILGIVG